LGVKKKKNHVPFAVTNGLSSAPAVFTGPAIGTG